MKKQGIKSLNISEGTHHEIKVEAARVKKDMSVVVDEAWEQYKKPQPPASTEQEALAWKLLDFVTRPPGRIEKITAEAVLKMIGEL